MRSMGIAGILLSCLVGCDHFELSPNQKFDGNTPRDLNARNLERLLSAPIDDTVTIAFVGDSQRFYDNVEAFVYGVNELPTVDFVILAGDISDFGLLSEYEWIERSFSRLNKPYFGVIGNHDVIANGERVFTLMFGPPDYSFVYDSIKFVVHNSNSREYPDKTVPDLAWLSSQLNDDDPQVKNYVGISHVPPDHPDFNPSLVEPYTTLLSSTPGFTVSLHGHIHKHTDGYPFNDDVRYITSFAFSTRSFVLLKIRGRSVLKSIVEY